ncbi:acetylglutamate kinase [Phototrophicus methaneseepsis]|uniref:Acetylglutamate kinase n=1 Tax=Phototrophicus methaneseepsis TaxID=2710758 RepID=A0A7S8E5F1_9CHLR|nr:acetylglutamate kinase [Phototrophicus methaneseepsis]QPC80706.1 acetylglutamate kinase [Phototrophicus methaneseepsis]
MTETWVIKISGHELGDEDFLATFAQTIADLPQNVVIVHGGGKEISELQTRLGIETHFADGVRITDADSLALVEMVLCGVVNKRLVRVLLNAGVQAIGLSGVDMGMVQATKLVHPTIDMIYTGQVASLHIDPLRRFIEQGLTPVLAPICYGGAHNYNVNADHVAGALAAALHAERVVFISNVPGVLVDEVVMPQATPSEVDALIADGTIYGGMIPKVQTALHVLQDGVPSATITNLDGLRQQTGTTFIQEAVQEEQKEVEENE